MKNNITANNDTRIDKEINNNLNNKNNNIDLNKGLKSENSNIVVNKNIIYNINNVVNISNQKNGSKRDKTNLSKAPQYRPLINKYDGNPLDKNNLLQMERRRLYGKNVIAPKKLKYDDIYKHYIPMYGNNRLASLNKYGINGINMKSNQEINKHEQMLPDLYNNRNIGNNYSNNIGSKIIINRRLKPLVNKKI